MCPRPLVIKVPVCCRENLGARRMLLNPLWTSVSCLRLSPTSRISFWGVEDLKSYFPCFLAPLPKSVIQFPNLPAFLLIRLSYSTFRTCPPGLSGSPYSPPNSVHTASSTQLRSIALYVLRGSYPFTKPPCLVSPINPDLPRVGTWGFGSDLSTVGSSVQTILLHTYNVEPSAVGRQPLQKTQGSLQRPLPVWPHRIDPTKSSLESTSYKTLRGQGSNAHSFLFACNSSLHGSVFWPNQLLTSKAIKPGLNSFSERI